jgi:hypothetical protein
MKPVCFVKRRDISHEKLLVQDLFFWDSEKIFMASSKSKALDCVIMAVQKKWCGNSPQKQKNK